MSHEEMKELGIMFVVMVIAVLVGLYLNKYLQTAMTNTSPA